MHTQEGTTKCSQSMCSIKLEGTTKCSQSMCSIKLYLSEIVAILRPSTYNIKDNRSTIAIPRKTIRSLFARTKRGAKERARLGAIIKHLNVCGLGWGTVPA